MKETTEGESGDERSQSRNTRNRNRLGLVRRTLADSKMTHERRAKSLVDRVLAEHDWAACGTRIARKDLCPMMLGDLIKAIAAELQEHADAD